MVFRPYKNTDADTIAKWINDEFSFRMWCADRFTSYPLSKDEFNRMYASDPSMKGLIAEQDGKTSGHLFVKNLGNGNYKFGLIIIDSSQRGKGIGKKMLTAALNYAKSELNAHSVCLSVFENNVSAYNCYKNLGFKETGYFETYSFKGCKYKYTELIYKFIEL